MLEVASGIYQLILPNPAYAALRYVNVYLVRGSNGYLLIDTGWDDGGFASLQRQLTKIGIDFKDIAQIVVTHTHPDHYGLANRLKQLSGAKLACHYLETEAIKLAFKAIKSAIERNPYTGSGVDAVIITSDSYRRLTDDQLLKIVKSGEVNN